MQQILGPQKTPITTRMVNVWNGRDQMNLLWSRVKQATGSPRLRQHLAELMRDNSIQPRDSVALARAVQAFNQQRIKYLREYPETYASPEKTLEWGVADCDDLTILTCAALRGVKIPCRAVFVGAAPKGSAGNIPFKHVYPEAWLPSGANTTDPKAGHWVALEAVKPVPIGWNFYDEKLKAGFRVRKATIGDREGPFKGDE